MRTFANRLSEALSKRGMTQSDLSRATGIGRNSISDYINGKYEAKQDNVFLIAKSLQVNEAWLMGFDGVEMEKADILTVYNRLNAVRKQKVFTLAENELAEQQMESKDDEPELLAAHLDDDGMTDDERQQVNDFLRKIRNDKTE